mmetsp:Transcript_7479/g.13015  ORF Transcript_7479/g.13015 Transcript_7479/m.13015 type:complete len:459 (+) Transcript_7479:120-1496(+)
MGRHGNRRRTKRRTHVDPLATPSEANAGTGTAVLGTGSSASTATAVVKKVPKSIVVRHGKSNKYVTQLVEDLRKVMMPYTALRLKERKNASLKDYTHVAGPLGVTHCMVVQQGKKAPNLKIARLPYGPTISFRVQNYALGHQVRSVQKKAVDIKSVLGEPPLVVLNNFEDDILADKRHLKIASLTFQSLFPAINVRTVKLEACKRVLLLHLNEEEETIDVRHYAVRTKVHGVSRNIKSVVVNNKVPNLGHTEDIADLLYSRSGAMTSDSEFEEDAKVQTDAHMPKHGTRIGAKRDLLSGPVQSVVKLSEIGPRMTLQMVKVEDGIFTGEVQYHAYEQRSAEEIERLRAIHEEKERLRLERKEAQEANVEKKRAREEEKRAKRKAKKQRRLSENPESGDVEANTDDESDSDNDSDNNSGGEIEEGEQSGDGEIESDDDNEDEDEVDGNSGSDDQGDESE